jgi:curli biogenesis system outer membrane secretion channel CsgG
MNRIKYAIIPLCGLGLIIGSAIFAKDPKPTIAVLDFKNKTGRGGYQLGSGAADMLTTQLFKIRKFSVVERDKLKGLINEQEIGATGLIEKKAAEIGRLIGAQYLVVGSVTEYGVHKSRGGAMGISGSRSEYNTTVDIRIINAATGEVVFADSGSGSESSSSARIFGIGGGETGDFNEKLAQESMRKAIIDVCDKIKKEDIKD